LRLMDPDHQEEGRERERERERGREGEGRGRGTREREHKSLEGNRDDTSMVRGSMQGLRASC
jgi:hypothetical protein